MGQAASQPVSDPSDSTDDQPTCSFAICGIRTQEALARFAGDEGRYCHWLKEFIGYGPSTADQIRQAIADGSQDAAIRLAHSFKGRAGMLGMTELHSIAVSLEKSLTNNEPSDLWLEELKHSANEMCEEISATLK